MACAHKKSEEITKKGLHLWRLFEWNAHRDICGLLDTIIFFKFYN
jgi:hypothetical protein